MRDGFDSLRERLTAYIQIGALLVIANVKYWSKRKAVR